MLGVTEKKAKVFFLKKMIVSEKKKKVSDFCFFNQSEMLRQLASRWESHETVERENNKTMEHDDNWRRNTLQGEEIFRKKRKQNALNKSVIT